MLIRNALKRRLEYFSDDDRLRVGHVQLGEEKLQEELISAF